jgi:hypothetical protein
MWARVWTTLPTTIAQPVALWNVIFLSKGMMSPRGERRTIEMKFLQTGSRMKITSTWRTRAAARAIAARILFKL